MTKFKTAALAASLAAFAATSATAGGMAEPIMTMEPDMVMEEAAGTSGGLLIPLILVALLAVALSDGGDALVPLDF